MCTIGSGHSSADATEPSVLHIYGPVGLRHYLYNSLSLSCSLLSYQYKVHELIPTADSIPTNWQVGHVEIKLRQKLKPI